MFRVGGVFQWCFRVLLWFNIGFGCKALRDLGFRVARIFFLLHLSLKLLVSTHGVLLGSL